MAEHSNFKRNSTSNEMIY